MKDKKPNAELVWKQLEDIVVPRLQLTLTDRAIYSHLLRHSRLEGRKRLHFSIRWLARSTSISEGPTRKAIRRLAGKGAVRLIERSKGGHILEVLLPQEIRGGRHRLLVPLAGNLEAMDFLQSRELREALHQREGGLCFYCLRHLNSRTRTLDHIVPEARRGLNSYGNLVSCCMDCNATKGDNRAEDFLRQLFRQDRLNAHELADRFKALKAVLQGKHKPVWGPGQLHSAAHKGVPPEGEFLSAANF